MAKGNQTSPANSGAAKKAIADAAAKKAAEEKATAEAAAKKAAEEKATAEAAAKKAAEEKSAAEAVALGGGAKTTKVSALSVVSSREGFRRGGRTWSKTETKVKLSELSEEQIAQIKGEALLTVEEIEIDGE